MKPAWEGDDTDRGDVIKLLAFFIPEIPLSLLHEGEGGELNESYFDLYKKTINIIIKHICWN